jgi:hypothetical protein
MCVPQRPFTHLSLAIIGIAWVWIYLRAPETKGQSLERIQQLWKEPARC